MTIYIDPTHTPARLLRKAYTGDSLISLKSNGLHTLTLKHHDQLPLDIVIINRKNVSNIRIGAKLSDTAHSSANATLLALGEDAEGSVEGNSTRFSLILNLNTEALNQAFAEDACHIFALTEITWQEENIDDALNISTITRISETLPTIIYNDIIRGSESIPAIDSNYPVAEAIATKDWVQQEQSSQNEEFASSLQSALYASETSTISSRTGNDNISCDWLQIAPKNISAGQLQQIRIKCRSNASAPIETAPIYLHIWEEQSDGSYAKLATSTNAITQALSQWSIWDFNQTPLSGRTLRLYASTDPNDHWSENFASLGTRCIARTSDDNDSLINTLGATGDINYEAETQFTILQTLPHFAAQSDVARLQEEHTSILNRLNALENATPQEAILPEWANCIQGNATGISEIKMASTSSIYRSNPEMVNSKVDILYATTGVTVLGSTQDTYTTQIYARDDIHMNGSSIQKLFSQPSASLPEWASCIQGNENGISEIRLAPIKGSIITHSNNTGNYNSRVTLLSCNTGVNPLSPPILEIGDNRIQHLNLLSKESCHIGAASQIALTTDELQVDATAISYLNAGNEGYPAWLDTVEGDAEGISQLKLKPNARGITTTPTPNHSQGIPLLQYAHPYGSPDETNLYIGSHNANLISLETAEKRVYQGEIQTITPQA